MISLRSAEESDVPLLAATGLAAWEHAVTGLVDAVAMRRVAELSFLSFLRSNWFSVRVVESGGMAAGWAAREDDDANISDLWINPAFQRCGLGSALLKDMEGRILSEGFEASIVKTHAQNGQAIGFFRKHGYAVSSLSTAYAAKLDKDVEAVSMTKWLSEAGGQRDQQWF